MKPRLPTSPDGSAAISASRRRFLSLIAAGAMWGALPGCRREPVPPLRIAAHTWPGYEPLFLADQMGWLDHECIRLVETVSATDSLAALAEGKADGAALTLDEVLRARAKGIPLSVVLAFDISAGADVLLARPGISKLEGLAGKRIGVEEGALGALMLAEVLQKAGVDPRRIEKVHLEPEGFVDAWKQGKIDAAITYEPTSTLLQELGAIRLFDSREIPNLIVDVLAVKIPILDDSRYTQTVRDLISADLRGLAHLHTSPDDFAHRRAAHLGLAPENVMGSFKGLVLPDIANNQRLLAGKKPALADSARDILLHLNQAGILPADDNLASLLRPEFLPAEAP